MKRLHSILGVTLLEIMLVLAIAAMVIVMSIRYYQSATSTQQSNVILQSVQAVTAAAENLASGSGSYASVVTTANIGAVVGAAGMSTPKGGANAITITGTPTATTYGVKVLIKDAGQCALVAAKLTGNAKYTGTDCDGSGDLSYTYDNTK